MEDLTKNPQSEDNFTNEQNDNPETTNPELPLEQVSAGLNSDEAKSELISDLDFSSLFTAADYMKYIGVTGLIGISILIVGLIILAFSGEAANAFSLLLFVIVFGIFPPWSIYNMGSNLQQARKATKIKDKIASIEKAFSYTETYWLFNGVITFLFVGFIVVMIVGGLLFTLSR